MNDLPYRPNVCILLHNREKKLLLAERFNTPGVWQFPQGGVELDQSIEMNVYREIEEELGLPLSTVEIVGCLKARHRYDFAVIPDYAVGVWRGQDQTFWVVKFRGADNQINVATAHPEFSAWMWCTPDEVRQRAEPRRITGYEPALKEFELIIESLE